MRNPESPAYWIAAARCRGDKFTPAKARGGMTERKHSAQWKSGYQAETMHEEVAAT